MKNINNVFAKLEFANANYNVRHTYIRLSLVASRLHSYIYFFLLVI